MPNQNAEQTLHEKRSAEFFSKQAEEFYKESERLKKNKPEEQERIRQECNDAACTLIYRMKAHGLPASVRISHNAHTQLKKRLLRAQTPERQALLQKLARDGGVPAKKVRMETKTPKVGLPFCQIAILP